MEALIYTDIINRFSTFLIANSLSESQIDNLISSFKCELIRYYSEEEVNYVVDLFKSTTNKLRENKEV